MINFQLFKKPCTHRKSSLVYYTLSFEYIVEYDLIIFCLDFNQCPWMRLMYNFIFFTTLHTKTCNVLVRFSIPGKTHLKKFLGRLSSVLFFCFLKEYVQCAGLYLLLLERFGRIHSWKHLCLRSSFYKSFIYEFNLREMYTITEKLSLFFNNFRK